MGNLDNRSFESGNEPEDVKESVETTEVSPSETTEEPQIQEKVEPQEEVEEIVEDTTEKDDTIQEEEKTEEELPPVKEVKTEEDPSQEVKPSRAQKRIQQILKENKDLNDRIAQLNTGKSDKLPFKANDAGEIEMTPEQLTEYINNQVQSTLTAQQEQTLVKQKADAWDDDVKDVMRNHPELDPASKVFNKDLSNTLVDLVKAANIDDNGNPTVKKLPSEIWGSMQNILKQVKTEGVKVAAAELTKKQDNQAIQDTVGVEKEEVSYSDEDIAQIQRTDPRKYAELIAKNII